MLNDLKGYCEKITLIPIFANEKGLFYKCQILDKIFTIKRKDDIYTITTFDDTVFNAFVAVLQPKYKSLVSCRRNVKLLGDPKKYNIIEFLCQKVTKVKTILGHFENVYLDMINEKDEKEGL